MTKIKPLPLTQEIETTAVLKKLAKAHQALAELKGMAASIPNEGILISTLSLQEAKDSSAIENIITTHDDLYRSDSIARLFVTVAAKEVHNYANALRYGFKQVKAHSLMMTIYAYPGNMYRKMPISIHVKKICIEIRGVFCPYKNY